MDALSDSVENLPMMAERSLIRVDDVDLFKLGEKDRERLIALLGVAPLLLPGICLWRVGVQAGPAAEEAL